MKSQERRDCFFPYDRASNAHRWCHRNSYFHLIRSLSHFPVCFSAAASNEDSAHYKWSGLPSFTLACSARESVRVRERRRERESEDNIVAGWIGELQSLGLWLKMEEKKAMDGSWGARFDGRLRGNPPSGFVAMKSWKRQTKKVCASKRRGRETIKKCGSRGVFDDGCSPSLSAFRLKNSCKSVAFSEWDRCLFIRIQTAYACIHIDSRCGRMNGRVLSHHDVQTRTHMEPRTRVRQEHENGLCTSRWSDANDLFRS